MSQDLSKLAIHTFTNKPWTLQEAVDGYAQRGVPGISVWVETIEGMSGSDVRKCIQAAGLKVPALVRGGFFCSTDEAERQAKIDRNHTLLRTAAEIDAEMLVLVVGAVPGQPLTLQREWVLRGIEAMIPVAEESGVKIAIEPLHPMYAAERSCINRMKEAREICEALRHPLVGIAVDVYHVWWDPDVEAEIALAGEQGTIFGFHLCDWRSPTRDLLNDRALMGDGCIDLARLRRKVYEAGFRGWEEVEIFSTEHWQRDQGEYVDQIIERYLQID